MIRLILLTFFFLNTVLALSQVNPYPSTAISDRLAAFDQAESMRQSSRFKHLEANCIGPSVFSGRVSEIAVNDDMPSHFFVAYASGGLWYTKNNGTTFTPMFDDQPSMTIGAIAVNWQDSIIWVGTGEVNSSRSSYAGTGMYKSEDWGKSWTSIGLGESHHIGRIVLDNRDKNVAHVAVLGHLYSDNPERGIYSTYDGGSTWAHSLYVSDQAGAVDIVRNPVKPDHLLAATWERSRKAWDFVESGVGSGIHLSTDNGKSWTLVTDGSNGFPSREGVGRIGLSVSSEGNYFAILDNYDRRPKSDKGTKGLQKDDLKVMSKAQFAAISEEELGKYLESNRFPKDYSAGRVKQMIATDSITPMDLGIYIEDANRLLFDTEVIGAEVYKSTDDGMSWTKTHKGYLDNIYYSYGYYFGQIRVNPLDEDMLYIMGVPLLISSNGGKSWSRINDDNVHADHHALWCSPTLAGHIINGNDGGINISYDNGESWIKCNDPNVGQFYTVNVDNAEPYNVYGGTQDNGVWRGPHNSPQNDRWQMRGDYPFKMIMGGDGMKIEIDPRNSNVVYTGYQFGNYFKMNLATKSRQYITPKHELGDRPYRWNWQSPILLSKHNPDIFYMGANKVLRSMNGGTDFTPISEDLTNGGKKGDVAFGTLTTLSESPHSFTVLYTGSDDGKLYRTTTAGATWEDISAGLPQDLWVSRVEASHHDEGTVYASLNGYRWDDWSPYLYKSIDYGDTWIDIGSTLPKEPINVVKEDPEFKEILYAGSDVGLYMSLDGGSSWESIQMNIPNVPIHDIVIQTEEDHLVVATHGRSFYIIDLTLLRESKTIKSDIVIKNVFAKYDNWDKPSSNYVKKEAIVHELQVYSSTSGYATLSINPKGKRKSLINLDTTVDQGWNIISIPMLLEDSEEYLTIGDYDLEVKIGGNIKKLTFSVIDLDD